MTEMSPQLRAAIARMSEQTNKRLWDAWVDAQPGKRLPYDIEQGWDAAWDRAEMSFLVFIENLIKEGLLIEATNTPEE